MCKKYILLICLVAFPWLISAKGIKITRLTAEMKDNPTMLNEVPRLGWQMTSDENGTRQTAYEIDIRDGLSGKPIWNSGKVISSQSQLIELNDALSSAKASGNYVWKVRAWDESDAPSAWSDEATFRYRSEERRVGKEC